MKNVSKTDPDDGGELFDPRVRAAMRQFTLGGDTLALEAAAAVRAATHAVDRLRSHGTESRGLSAGALDILIRLSATTGGISLGELARASGVSARNVTGLVDTLERASLAERLADERDRRSVRASITPAGLEWLEAFRKPTQVAMAALFRGFSAEELTELRQLCLRLVANHKQIAEHLGRVGQESQ